jgi:NAD(P)-dependent dehydrogenase (short-subunit alcohol dehydrogenase family)
MRTWRTWNTLALSNKQRAGAGNSGIGTETVRALAVGGARVVFTSRSLEAGEAVAADLRKDPRVKAGPGRTAPDSTECRAQLGGR